MILDRLENAEKNGTLAPEVAMAFEYLRRTDFSQVPNGRYELDGDRVYAVVQRYRPKPLADAVWEAHRNYLDVQYVAEGSERMGWAPLHDGLTVRQSYDPQKDFILYHADGEFFTVHAGGFMIFAPHDVHAPGVAIDGADASDEVCKVVVKCRVA
jgi:YhcH/YjgK/YiaL family protein